MTEEPALGLPEFGWFGRILGSRPRLLIVLLFAAALAALLSLSAWLCWRSYHDAYRVGTQQLRTIAQTLDQHALRSFSEVARIVWSANEFIDRFEQRQGWDEVMVHERLRHLTADTPQIRSLLVADEHGRIIADSRALPARPMNVSQRDYFIAQRDNDGLGPFIGGPIVGQIDSLPLIGLSQRLTGRDGRFAGIVNASIDLRYFELFYHSLGISTNRVIALFRNDGRLLLAEPRRNGALLSDYVAEAIGRHRDEAGEEVLSRDPLRSGEHGVYVVRHLEKYGLALMVGMSDRDMLAMWRQETERVVLVISIAAILLCIGLYLVLRYLGGLHRAQATGQRLMAAIDQSQDVMSLYDHEDRLWFANRQFWRMNPNIARLGARFEDMLNEGIARGYFPSAFGRDREWVEARLQRRQTTDQPFEVERQNGRWLMVREQRLPEGGIITVASDITARKAAEKALHEQAERHRRVIDTVPHGICATDTDNNILFANKAMHRLFALEDGGLVGRNLFEFEINQEAAQRRRDLFSSWMSKGKEPQRYVHQFRTAKGALIEVEVDWDYSRGPRGEIDGFAGVFTDVTELRRAKDRLQDAVDSVDSGLSLFDADDRLVLCNAAYLTSHPGVGSQEALLGKTFLEIAKLTMASSAGLGEPEADAAVEERVQKHRNPSGEAFEQRAPDGRWLLVHEHRTREGGIVAIRTDITGRKLQERALIEAKTQAELANRAKSDFLANMSHELRTPLNAIIGFAEMLTKEYFGKLNAKQQEYAGHIQSSGEHLLNIINDILDMSKIEAGRFELTDETVRLNDPVEACLQIVSGRASEAGVSLINGVPQSDIEIRIDTRSIKQVLLNLLSNAIKFTPPGGEVRIEAIHGANGDLTFSIEDTGVGISPQNIEKIFEPFLQADGSVSRKFGGTGLGLAISKKLMEAHQGQLQIESRLDHGTKVRAVLPAARVRRPRSQLAAAG